MMEEKTMNDILGPYVGKYVGLQMVIAGQLAGLGGLLKEEDGCFYIHKERTVNEQMVPTPQGMMRQVQVSPATDIYLKNIQPTQIAFIEVQLETKEEATEAIKKADEPMIKPARTLPGQTRGPMGLGGL